jgi:hypothetical protein
VKHGFDFDRNAGWQSSHADGGTRMFTAFFEDGIHDRGGTVAYLRERGEAWDCVDKNRELGKLNDPVKISTQGVIDPVDDVCRANPSAFQGRFNIDFVPDLPDISNITDDLRYLSGHIQDITDTLGGRKGQIRSG